MITLVVVCALLAAASVAAAGLIASMQNSADISAAMAGLPTLKQDL